MIVFHNCSSVLFLISLFEYIHIYFFYVVIAICVGLLCCHYYQALQCYFPVASTHIYIYIYTQLYPTEDGDDAQIASNGLVINDGSCIVSMNSWGAGTIMIDIMIVLMICTLW